MNIIPLFGVSQTYSFTWLSIGPLVGVNLKSTIYKGFKE